MYAVTPEEVYDNAINVPSVGYGEVVVLDDLLS